MTIDTAKLRALAAGFSGRFFYDAERGDIGYIAKKCEDKQCDCAPSYNADGDIDCSVSLLDDTGNVDYVGEPIADMLNAVGPLLDEIERLRGSALRPLTEREIQQALHEGRAESMAATGDNAWTSLLRQRDEAHEQLRAMTAARDEACDIAMLGENSFGDVELARIAELRKVGQ